MIIIHKDYKRSIIQIVIYTCPGFLMPPMVISIRIVDDLVTCFINESSRVN